jgi:hypothetical protein
LAFVLARIIDENLAHQMSGDAEKMRAAFPVGMILRNQAHVGLVNQCGGLQRLRRAFVGEVMAGEPAQLVVYQRRQGLDGRLVAALPFEQKSGDFFEVWHVLSLYDSKVAGKAGLKNAAILPDQ